MGQHVIWLLTAGFVIVLVLYVCARKRNSRKLLELETDLRHARMQLDAFIDNHVDAVMMIDTAGRLLRANRAFEEMFGWTFDELRHCHVAELPSIPQSERAAAGELLRSAQEGQFLFGQEAVRQKKNGKSIHIILSVIPFPSSRCYAVIMKNISELRDAQEMLSRSETLSVVGQLAAGVAHEIKNPLTALKGFTQLLDVSMAGAHRAYFDIMKEELNRIELIANEMLVLAKPKVIHFEQKSLPDILDFVIALLGTQAVMKSIEIVTDFEPVPLVECEEHQLKQVFVNLIKNAVEAMEHSGTIRVSIRRWGEDGVLVRIKDQGPGIPEELLPRLTEPFYTTKEKGTGLGLMMTASIIDRHQGTMQIESALGEGTTVGITLPVSQASAAQRH